MPIAPRTVSPASVYSAGIITSASSASNRIRRGTTTQDRRGVQGVQVQGGQGEAGGNFIPAQPQVHQNQLIKLQPEGTQASKLASQAVSSSSKERRGKTLNCRQAKQKQLKKQSKGKGNVWIERKVELRLQLLRPGLLRHPRPQQQLRVQRRVRLRRLQPQRQLQARRVKRVKFNAGLRSESSPTRACVASQVQRGLAPASRVQRGLASQVQRGLAKRVEFNAGLRSEHTSTRVKTQGRGSTTQHP